MERHTIPIPRSQTIMIEIILEIAQWAGLLILLYANGQQAKWIRLLVRPTKEN